MARAYDMLLTVEQLSYRYPRSSNDALHELSFSIAEGEIFGFLGPSGAGKSTTQKILYKLLQGYRGEVTFAGKTLGNWGRDFYEQIGVSFELPNHYLKLTAEENLRFFAAFYRKKSAEPLEFLRKVGLEE
ncbi:MAG: ATP-binding cassette domain-containing protein, partial [Saprospiraceae bacterium]|nr:ATP-binding cassette domain-containing protein [Saprospiraceae bacterium]